MGRRPLSEPLSRRERGWGEGSRSLDGARSVSLAAFRCSPLRTLFGPHPARCATFSRWEKGNAGAFP